jgi:SAM-dependent methyltransferase
VTGGRWYERAFGRHYLTVYAHRDEGTAAREAGFAIEALRLSPAEPVLDLACGWGRHARALAARGLRVFGLDLSEPLLAEARRRDPGFRCVRGDMRHLPFVRHFRAVTLFFTSFGYFGGAEEDRMVLRGVSRALVPGGGFLLDYANRAQVIASLVPESESGEEGTSIHEKRSMSADGLRVEKHVRIVRPEGDRVEYTESVRLYSPGEITGLLTDEGFEVRATYGDLSGREFRPDSPRFVVVGAKPC